MRRSNRLSVKAKEKYGAKTVNIENQNPVNCKTEITKPRKIVLNDEKQDQKLEVLHPVDLKVDSICCAGCLLEDPPVVKYSEATWLRCDFCNKWWHLECALLEPDSAKVFSFIKYPCVLCILNKSPWIKDRLLNETVKPSFIEIEEKNNKIQSETNVKDHIIQKDIINIPNTTVTANEKSSAADNFDTVDDEHNKSSRASDSRESIIIVDNIDNPKEFCSSRDIVKKIKEKGISDIDFAYSLPRGGIVLQCKNEKVRQKLQDSWPGPVFGECETIHQPAKESDKRIGYLRNIDPRLPEKKIEHLLTTKNLQVESVEKCFHRHSGKPMPVAKITFESNESLQHALEVNLELKFNGRITFLEKERQTKIIRCFKCMKFGHIARDCKSDTLCENCGKQGHLLEHCLNSTCCANCEGTHKASSPDCPVFQDKMRKLRIQDIL